MAKPKIVWGRITNPKPPFQYTYIGRAPCKRDGVSRTVAMVVHDANMTLWAWHLVGSGIGHMGYENNPAIAQEMAEMAWQK
ncbi:unnamed protein product, partial [marine sediment metagenome]